MRVIWNVAVGLAFFLTAGPPGRLVAQDYRALALRILKTVPLVDGHNDIPDAIRERGGLDSVDFAVLQPKLMTDIPKLRAGGVGAQFWAAYVPVTTLDSGPHPAVYALEQIDLIKRLCAKYPRDLALARTAADVERNFKAGKISCLIGIEGGHAIENSLGALRMFAALGVRYITLTHWRSLPWATASTDTARRGLSSCGRGRHGRRRGFDPRMGSTRAEGDPGAGGEPHRAHPRRGRDRCGRTRLRLRRDNVGARRARRRVKVSRSHRGALASRVE